MIKIDRIAEPSGLAARRAKQLSSVGAVCPELEEFTHHVKHTVMPVVRDIRTAYTVGLPASFAELWHRKCAELLDPERSCLALSEDVLRHEFPSYPSPPPGP